MRYQASLMRLRLTLAVLFSLPAAGAHASPGHGDEADDPVVEQGELGAGLSYHRLAGGPANGADILLGNLSYDATSRLRIGLQAGLEGAPGTARKLDSLGIEALHTLGRLGPIDTAIYGTYDIAFDGTDTIETRLVLGHARGPVAVRVNLIASRELQAGAPLELGYAFAADYAVHPRWTLSAIGFGELGGLGQLLPHGGHAIGPAVSYRLSPGIQVNAGYLVTLGKAREDARGQIRIGLEFSL